MYAASSTFTEAWDLLLSNSSNGPLNQRQPQVQAGRYPTPPSPKPSTRPWREAIDPSRTASRQRPLTSGSESRATTARSTASPRSTHAELDTGKAITNLRTQLSNSQSTGADNSSQEPSPDVSRLLQSIRHDLDSLQSPSSNSPRDDLDTLTVSLLNQKFERLTDAVASNSSSVTSSAKASERSSIDGGSISSSSKDNDQDLRCWESCCGGRKFSNKSNIIRHQRERSGETGKLRCSFCSACFSRSSARNAHEAKRICRTSKNNHSYS